MNQHEKSNAHLNIRRLLIALASAGAGAVAMAMAAQALGLGEYGALLFFAIAASVTGHLLLVWEAHAVRRDREGRDHG